MDRKKLGNTSVEIPAIGLGTWKYTGGVEPLRRGVELGAFFLDTAEVYGTEDVVGQAVKGIRDNVFIATKVSGSHLKEDEVLRAAEQSLRLLDVDVIDLYQVHWPSSRVPIEETMRAMQRLVDSGQVRYVGVSNFSLRELQQAQAAMPHYPVVSNQVLYNLNRRNIERDLVPYCRDNDITVIAYTPLDDGKLAAQGPSRGGDAGRPRGQGSGVQVLQQIAKEIGKTPAQVALNWCASQPNVVPIPKSNSVARVEENCSASGWKLSEEHLAMLDRAFPQ